MKKIFLVSLLATVSLSLFAQTVSPRPEEENVISFNKQTAFGVQLRTNGYGGYFELGRMKSPRFSNIYTAEFTEIKDRKEEKLGSTENIFGNSFVFGKINNFYQFKLGFGQQYIFGQKGNRNGVAVIGIYQGGFSAGLLRPYYIQVRDPLDQTVRNIKYSQKDSALFIDENSIIGGGGFTTGWGEMKLEPGAFAKAALRFDFGRFNETISALEIGVSADYYFNKIPILLFNEPRNLFYQGHIAFIFGRRK